jgi:hypothetical protein
MTVLPVLCLALMQNFSASDQALLAADLNKTRTDSTLSADAKMRAVIVQLAKYLGVPLVKQVLASARPVLQAAPPATAAVIAKARTLAEEAGGEPPPEGGAPGEPAPESGASSEPAPEGGASGEPAPEDGSAGRARPPVIRRAWDGRRPSAATWSPPTRSRTRWIRRRYGSRWSRRSPSSSGRRRTRVVSGEGGPDHRDPRRGNGRRTPYLTARSAMGQPSFSARYRPATARCGRCPIEVGLLGRLADHECRHGRLRFDSTPACGCWPEEGAVVLALPGPAHLAQSGAPCCVKNQCGIFCARRSRPFSLAVDSGRAVAGHSV